ncbi:MAG: S8 family serine peptidase [Flavobacteriia bacterium]|nr:S8 family serine peptidase [Flavobacteriia bacterium]
MKQLTLLFLLFILGFQTQAQQRFWVFLEQPDHNSTAALLNPEQEGDAERLRSMAMLSNRALERRERLNIPLRESDLSFKSYGRSFVERRLRERGYTVRGYSRWLRAYSVEVESKSELEDFISEFRYFENGCGMEKARHLTIRPIHSMQVQRVNQTLPLANPMIPAAVPPRGNHWYNYGEAYSQTDMVNGHFLHDEGYDGRDMLIAVLDGSFFGADEYGGLARIYDEGRIVAEYDFVNGDTNVYRGTGTHGSRVFSIMGADVDGRMVGAAPKASYALLRTEDEQSETHIEEDNWIFAMEFADSIGADVINTSLGYTTFDSGVDYTPADMDGRTAVVTYGATMAHRAGMVVVSSAGNSGATSWRIISAPADADSILAVGAVDSNEVVGLFSSRGPSADGRVKPDVMAQGVLTSHLGTFGVVTRGNGTSFSSPVIAGFAACFWQANPEASNYEIMEWIRQSSDRYGRPNSDYGYGIPDFRLAMALSGATEADDETLVYPNPTSGWVNIRMPDAGPISYSVATSTGHEVQSGEISFPQNTSLRLSQTLTNGVYILTLHSTSEPVVVRLVLNR